jgi:outer membrane protein assembly factor BamB
MPAPAKLIFITILALVPSARADDWPQWAGPRRDGIWREDGIVDKFPTGGPSVRWRAPSGSGYAGPAVAGNRVYHMDFRPRKGSSLPTNGMGKSRLSGIERIVCLDDATGKEVWKHEYDCDYSISFPSGPRTTPVVAGDKVYTLGAMGDLLCLNAETGKVAWAVNLPKTYADAGKPNGVVPLWGYAASLLLDGDRLITLAGGDGSIVVALNKDTGKEIWRALSAFSIGYCPPAIYTVGSTRQLIIWQPEAVCGLEPETGKILWEAPFQLHKSALAIPVPQFDGKRLFITSFYNSALMLSLDTGKPGASVLWQGKLNGQNPELPEKTSSLHSIMPTPVFKDGYIYGVDSYGELRCLKADTGARVWTALGVTRALKGGKRDESKPTQKDRWNNAFITPHGDRYFLFNEAGELIIATMDPGGYTEIDRAKIIAADDPMPGRDVVWSHPAYAHKSVYVRNDHELVCVSLEKK